jgi:hypothetical protein
MKSIFLITIILASIILPVAASKHIT